MVTVFINTSRFGKEDQYFGSCTVDLAVPTDSTSELLHYALRCAWEAFREGCRYKKAGVLFNKLVPAGIPSRSLWDPDRR